MSDFDQLTTDGKLSAVYGQVLEAHTKLNDILARVARMEAILLPASLQRTSCPSCGSPDKSQRYFVKDDPSDTNPVFTTTNSHRCDADWHDLPSAA